MANLDSQIRGARADSSIPIRVHFAQPPTGPEGDQEGVCPDWVKLTANEIQWLCGLPVTSPTVPLVFVNDPTVHGEFNFPSRTEMLQPNSGFHALRVGCQANAAFLTIENRFCKLIALLSAMQPCNNTVSLSDWLERELNQLNHEKAHQWTQQGHPADGRIVVNTSEQYIGDYFFYILQLL
jgi:hypothetical protein